jgi:hypothetical protein
MGKTLSVIGGILALLGTFVFAWAVWIFPSSGYGLLNISDIITTINAMTGSDVVIGYICLILLILTSISGIMILIGAKIKGLAIFFGLVATVMGLLMILVMVLDLGDLDLFMLEFFIFGMRDYIVVNVLPYVFQIGTTGIYLGQIFLLVGGLLGLIGGATTKKD